MTHPFSRDIKKPKIKHSLYNRWSRMKQCLFNPNHEWFYLYGGKGITMDSEWENKYESFLLWAIKNGYKKELVLTRKDKNLGFTPNNCFWGENAYSTESVKI